MKDKQLQFVFSPEVWNLGVRGVYFLMHGLQNKNSHPDVEEKMRRVVQDTLGSSQEPQDDPILQGFRSIHEAVGRTGKDDVSSPENLIRFVRETGRCPRVNLVVDIYNLISLKTKLALGAHDCARVVGNVTLRLTTGEEGFWPLGSKKPKKVHAGEYAYVDDANDVICRLEVRQVEKTKIMIETSACFFIIQGNLNTTADYLKETAREVIALISLYCGGEAEFLYVPSDEINAKV